MLFSSFGREEHGSRYNKCKHEANSKIFIQTRLTVIIKLLKVVSGTDHHVNFIVSDPHKRELYAAYHQTYIWYDSKELPMTGLSEIKKTTREELDDNLI